MSSKQETAVSEMGQLLSVRCKIHERLMSELGQTHRGYRRQPSSVLPLCT